MRSEHKHSPHTASRNSPDRRALFSALVAEPDEDEDAGIPVLTLEEARNMNEHALAALDAFRNDLARYLDDYARASANRPAPECAPRAPARTQPQSENEFLRLRLGAYEAAP